MPSVTSNNNQRILVAALVIVIAGIVVLPALLKQVGAAVVLALAAFVVFAFVHPFVPLTLYFITLFFSDTTFDGALPISLNQVLAPLFFLSTGLYFLRRKTMALHSTLLPLLGITAIYFAVNGLLGENFENGVIYGRYVVIYLLLTVSIAACMSTERAIISVAWIVTGITAAFALHGFYDLFDKNLLGNFSGNWGSSIRLKGTAPNSVVFAWNMLYAFPFAFFLFSELRSRYTRPIAILFGLLPVGAAAVTFNRQTYVLTAVIVALCSVLFIYRNRAILLGGVIALGTLGAFTIMPLIIKRFLTVTDISKDYSYLERRDSYLMALEMIKSSPIFGIGFGSYSKVWSQYIPEDYSTYYAQYRGGTVEKFMDMGYMAITAETGIIGLLLFLSILILILVRGIKYWKNARNAGDHFARNLSSLVLVLLSMVAITSLIQDTFLYTRVWIFYAFALLLDERLLPIRPANESGDETGTAAVAVGVNPLPE